MKQLRWLAAVPLVLGILFLFVAMLWTELVQFGVAVALFAAAATVWRAFRGPVASPPPPPAGSA